MSVVLSMCPAASLCWESLQQLEQACESGPFLLSALLNALTLGFCLFFFFFSLFPLFFFFLTVNKSHLACQFL